MNCPECGCPLIPVGRVSSEGWSSEVDVCDCCGYEDTIWWQQWDGPRNYSDENLSGVENDPVLPNGLTAKQWDDLSQMRKELHGGGEQGEP